VSEQPGAESLVVAPENEDAQPLSSLEGGGVFSSWADLNAAVSADDVDPGQVAFTAAAAGLDTLGAIVNPLDSLLSAGVGWLIEHVWFLHEPLDALAGDPTQITAQAQTWNNVGGELAAIARDHRGAAAALSAWEGSAGDGYRGTADRFDGALEQAGRDAVQLADLILTSGAQVGTVRALIRDSIADFVTEVIKTVAFYGVASLITAGGALGVGAVQLIVRALNLADKIYQKVKDLLDAMTLAGGMAAQISGAIQQTATAVRAAMPTLDAIDKAAGDLQLSYPIEAGKQVTGAEQGQRAWGPTPTGDP
jgi:uncharacterized protein YukE